MSETFEEIISEIKEWLPILKEEFEAHLDEIGPGTACTQTDAIDQWIERLNQLDLSKSDVSRYKAQLEKQIEKIGKEIMEANAVEELTSDPSDWSEGYDNGAEAMVKRFLGILKAEKTEK